MTAINPAAQLFIQKLVFRGAPAYCTLMQDTRLMNEINPDNRIHVRAQNRLTQLATSKSQTSTLTHARHGKHPEIHRFCYGIRCIQNGERRPWIVQFNFAIGVTQKPLQGSYEAQVNAKWEFYVADVE